MANSRFLVESNNLYHGLKLCGKNLNGYSATEEQMYGEIVSDEEVNVSLDEYRSKMAKRKVIVTAY